MKLTAKILGEMIYEELEKEDWGDIEPWWFVGVESRPGDETDIEECSEDYSGDVLKVLEKVVRKIKLLGVK